MIFIGGGSLLLKNSLLRMVDTNFATFIDDVHANARGYEYIAYEMQTRP